MSIASAIVRTLIDCLELSRDDAASFLTTAGIELTCLEDPYGRISLEQWSKLQLIAYEHSNDPACGLHLAERTTIGAFSVLGYLFLNCDTARTSLRQFFRYYELLMDAPKPGFIEDGTQAKLIYHHKANHPDLSRFCAEYVLTCLWQIGNKFSTRTSDVIEIGFQHSAPDYLHEYQRLFPCPVLFNRDSDYIIYDRASLDIVQPHGDAYLVQLLEQRADEILSIWRQKQSLSNRIETHLRNHECLAKSSLGEVAKCLNLSSRSLRRKLQEEGTSFSRVVDDVSAAIAKHQLTFARTSIQEIAYNLGFSQPSSFHRAFKRWTGMTPAQFVTQIEHASSLKLAPKEPSSRPGYKSLSS